MEHLGRWMRAGRLGEAPRTPVQEFQKNKGADLVPSARTVDAEEHPIYLPCVTIPTRPRRFRFSD